MLNRVKALWVTEPVRVVTALVAAVVFVAAKVGVVLEPQDVGSALLLLLPIVLGGEVARAKVSPAAPGTIGPPSDHLLAEQLGGPDATPHPVLEGLTGARPNRP